MGFVEPDSMSSLSNCQPTCLCANRRLPYVGDSIESRKWIELIEIGRL
jgi:hypothetical protein